MAELTVLRKQTKWEDLFFYKKAVVLDQLTYEFCRRFLPKYGDRTVDQMVQAARSGKQNIVEGLADGVTSTEMELKLLALGGLSPTGVLFDSPLGALVAALALYGTLGWFGARRSFRIFAIMNRRLGP